MTKIIHPSLNQFPPSIFLSGVESNKYWDIVVNQGQAQSVLTSYYYYRHQKDKDILRKRLDITPNVRILIDSGAFTLMQNKSGDLSVEEVEEYLEEYTAWARDNKDILFAVVGMDLEKVFGYKQTLAWNKKYFEPLEQEGLPVCYIWHVENGIKAFEDYCRKYHYVGISGDIFESKLNPDTLLRKLLAIAKKYGTVVHGMAFTKSQLLVKHPLYSTDSTTWLVGQQYGELNWWNGRQMTRLKKKDWQRTYKTKLLRPPFNADWDKLMHGMGGKGDTYELLRLNVVAYIDAEEHIRKRVKTQSYWLKGNGKGVNQPMKIDKVKLLKSKLPDEEWFEGEMNDIAKYLGKLNLPTDYDKEDAVHILKDFCRFINKEFDDWDDDRILDNASNILGEDFDDVEEAQDALHKYYVENALGERNDFHETSDEDEDTEVEEGYSAKPRTSYKVDPEVIEIEMTEDDLPPPNHDGLLPPPSGMDEVDAYDAQLAGLGITVVRDSKGRFVKGHRVQRVVKNIVADVYPQLVCRTCYKSGDCPEYQDGYVCAFDKQFKAFDSRKQEDVLDAMASITNLNLTRLQKATIFETLDGGMPTGEVSALIDQNMRLLEKMQQVLSKTPTAVLNQRKVYNADGSVEVETNLRANPTDAQSGGILSKLFSGMKLHGTDDDGDYEVVEEKKVKASAIDVEATPVVDKKKKILKKPAKKKKKTEGKIKKYKYERQ